MYLGKFYEKLAQWNGCLCGDCKFVANYKKNTDKSLTCLSLS